MQSYTNITSLSPDIFITPEKLQIHSAVISPQIPQFLLGNDKSVDMLLFRVFHKKYVVICDWFCSLDYIFKVIYVVEYKDFRFFLLLGNIPSYGETS